MAHIDAECHVIGDAIAQSYVMLVAGEDIWNGEEENTRRVEEIAY
jgi:hypothetical protein